MKVTQEDGSLTSMRPRSTTGGHRFLIQSEAARLLRLSERTLERWRLEGNGPPYRRFGRRVVYGDEDLIIWADQQRRTSTSD